MRRPHVVHWSLSLALALAAAGCASTGGETGNAGGSGDEGGSGGSVSTGGVGGTGAAGGSSGGAGTGGDAGASGSAGSGGGAGGGAGSGGGRADAAMPGPDALDAAVPVLDGPKPVTDARPADRAADIRAAGDGGACPGPNPHEGFTEYQDMFKVQHPYDLPESDRFSSENGVYTAWITKDDKGYSPGTPTGPRTEMRWFANWTTGERMWEADVMYETGTTHCAIMQVKGNAVGAPIYLQVNDGALRNSVRPVFLNDTYDRWMHINVAYNPDTGVGRVWVDNCLLLTITNNTKDAWYFKNGVYGCDTARCRAHFKNIRLWKK